MEKENQDFTFMNKKQGISREQNNCNVLRQTDLCLYPAS